MPRRWTITDKWTQDKWFKRLRPLSKLMFLYLCENCDCAGIWEIDVEDVAYLLGANVELIEQALSDIGRCYFRNERFLILKNFIYHQGNLPLNPSNNCHKGILKRLGEHPDFWERLKEYWQNKGWVVIDRNLFNRGKVGAAKGHK